MAKEDVNDPGSTTTDTPTSPPPPARGYPEHDGGGGRSSTDTVAAVTVAILAVIIVITCVLVARAIRKRRRARQGTRMDQRIPAISTGVMGTRAYKFILFFSCHVNNDPTSCKRYTCIPDRFYYFSAAAAYSNIHISQPTPSSAVSWEPIETQQYSEYTTRDLFPVETNQSANDSGDVSSNQAESS